MITYYKVSHVEKDTETRRYTHTSFSFYIPSTFTYSEREKAYKSHSYYKTAVITPYNTYIFFTLVLRETNLKVVVRYYWHLSHNVSVFLYTCVTKL